ncbi:MAG TPA: GntR family transcriptional regulator [Actinomycetes bacterium]|nr:GntR family transcriptional regulator [Actinomycetes bacterium]
MERVDGGMQRASGAQLVYGELRERILDLRLEPGARLHEAELAAELAVSRTPLREALRMLLAEDLVEQLPTGGTVVRRLDLQDMRELYAVRAALEGLAVREACQRLTWADLEALEGLVERMRLLVDHPAELTRLGGEFHARIATIAGNRRCEQLLRQLDGHMRRYRALTSRRQPRRLAALEDHRALFEALRARDPDAAERTVRDHVMAACREGEAAAAGLLEPRSSLRG